MRIISGKYKGKRLIAPKNLPVRPTADMQKEALFNILDNQYYFENLKILDLFSGTGNIAYEFASRGTNDITAVDSHYACVKYIDRINKELGFTITSIKSDVFQYLKRTPQQFDIIFADPPYDFSKEKFKEIHELVFERNLLTVEKGLLIIEHSSKTDLSDLKHFINSRRYGGSHFSFFE
jgi:16S rRNA (guanine(966)-N(2))-methyltransferase RsmD